jgi:RNA polymerase sigma-70 factor (ECF subfamily)
MLDTVRPVSQSEHALIERILGRDETAMSDLYDRYADLLLALAYRILGERADAEDIVLEVLERAWREADRFDPSRGSLRTWLAVMVRSRALDQVRAQRRHARVQDAAMRIEEPALTVSPISSDPADDAERGDARRHVMAALRELPDAQREAIELAYYGGLSQSEIAQRLDTPLGTVKTRIRDGMQRLRNTLRPLYAEHG